MSLDAGDLSTRVSQSDVLWALGSVCALHGVAFDVALVAREFPPLDGDASSRASFIAALRSLGFRVKQHRMPARQVERMVFPLVVQLRGIASGGDATYPTLGIVTAASDGKLILYRAGSNRPAEVLVEDFAADFAAEPTLKDGMGTAWLIAPEPAKIQDPDAAGVSRRFGFRWFVPELLKHKKVWRDVLLASLALQLIALATPLFTQAIIDKVVVHRTQSTLLAIGVAMLIFTAFSGLLSWLRQYLVLHTGNRVDAVLGSAIWAHLLKLPLRYFERRPTGVVAARLHGVETIREFVSGAAVTLVLDLPFLVVCLGVMLWYSVPLTAIALAVLLVITAVSVVVVTCPHRVYQSLVAKSMVAEIT